MAPQPPVAAACHHRPAPRTAAPLAVLLVLYQLLLVYLQPVLVIRRAAALLAPRPAGARRAVVIVVLLLLLVFCLLGARGGPAPRLPLARRLGCAATLLLLGAAAAVWRTAVSVGSRRQRQRQAAAAAAASVGRAWHCPAPAIATTCDRWRLRGQPVAPPAAPQRLQACLVVRLSSQSLSSSRDTSSLDSSSSSSDSDSAFLFLPAPLPRRPPATLSSSLSRLLSLSDILAGCCNVPGGARCPDESAESRWQRSTQQELLFWDWPRGSHLRPGSA